MNTAVLLDPPSPVVIRRGVQNPTITVVAPKTKKPEKKFTRPLAYAALFTLLTIMGIILWNMNAVPSPHLSNTVLSSLTANYQWSQYHRVARPLQTT